MRTPHDVNTTSNWPVQHVRQARDVALHERGARREADFVGQGARLRDRLAEKSAPVTTAPMRAQLSVSRPKWHCRCSSDVPS